MLKFEPIEKNKRKIFIFKFWYWNFFLTGESVSFLTTNEIFDGIFRRSIEIVDANPFDGLTPSYIVNLFWRVNFKKKKKKDKGKNLFFLLLQP